MTKLLTLGGLHHLAFTVTDVERAKQFYTQILGFQIAGEANGRVLLINDNVALLLAPAPDPARLNPTDRFDENRVGLDHFSFSVPSRADLEQAVRLFDERHIPHGTIDDLGPNFNLYVLAFRDPDNIQLELTAPYPA